MFDNPAESPCSSEQEQYNLFQQWMQAARDRLQAIADAMTDARMKELEDKIKNESNSNED